MSLKLFYSRATANYHSGNYQNAIDDCNEALVIRPIFHQAVVQRAMCHNKLNNFAEAIKDFNTALTMKNDDKVRMQLYQAQIELSILNKDDGNYYTYISCYGNFL